MLRRRVGSDLGFTLIELLLAVTILGIITVPLANLLIEYFQDQTQVVARLNESHDAQIAAQYFAEDAANTGTRDQTTQAMNQSVWIGSPSGAPYSCGSGTPVVLFAWDTFTTSGVPATAARTIYEVAYTTQNSGTSLVRTYCPGGGPGTATSLTDAMSASPLISYTSGTGQITMVLTIHDVTNSGSSYLVTLTGQRRQT